MAELDSEKTVTICLRHAGGKNTPELESLDYKQKVRQIAEKYVDYIQFSNDRVTCGGI